MTVSIADVLSRAADLIERDGWIQDAFGGPGSGWCAAGALRLVAGGSPATGRSHLAARDALGRSVGRSITLWNDDPARTKAEVVTTLRETAVMLREVS